MAMQTATPRLISNDDGWLVSAGVAEATPATIQELMVSTYVGTQVDTVSWCVGNSEVYSHETEIGEGFGEGYAQLSERDRLHRRNREHLIEVAGGPLTEITRQFHEAGMNMLASVRMNSHYTIDYASPGHGEFRRQHADCLLGEPDEYIPAPTVEYAIRRGVDYKHAVVREHMESIICELFERFDVDGVELDYMRHPAFFRVDEGLACRYLMTDFLRRIRRRLEAAAKERGRGIELLVRMPPTLADCGRLGLDVERWIGDGLVDSVAAGGGFTPFEMPIGEFVAAAKGTDCQILGSLEALRPCVNEAALRGLAARYWEAGVDGLFLFNYYHASPSWKQQILGDLVDGQRLPGLSKRYELDHSDRVRGKEGHAGAFHHAHPLVSLPVVLAETLPEGGCELTLEVAGQLEAALSGGETGTWGLSLGVENLGAEDALEVFLNGSGVPWEGRSTQDGWTVDAFDGAPLETVVAPRGVEGTMVRLHLPPATVQPGANHLRIRLVPGGEATDPVRLTEVWLDIDYEGRT